MRCNSCNSPFYPTMKVTKENKVIFSELCSYCDSKSRTQDDICKEYYHSSEEEPTIVIAKKGCITTEVLY